MRSPSGAIKADIVAFTHDAPQDFRTSAIAAFTYSGASIDEQLDAARQLAAPFALIEAQTGDIDLYGISSDAKSTELVHSIPVQEIPELAKSVLARSLEPRIVRAAKAGDHQLALFPLDAQLLINARVRSIDSIERRLERSFLAALEETKDPTMSARFTIGTLAARIVNDKTRDSSQESFSASGVDSPKLGSYFDNIAIWSSQHPELYAQIRSELGEDVDYSAIDARSINAVYERLFLTSELRKKHGIFHTDPQFATAILDHLPIEKIPPKERLLIDPACGSGNLLLAALDRLQNLAPGVWSADETHQWLKAHIYGSDIEPIAVEIAKLSLLISSMPLGNSWRVEVADAADEDNALPWQPTVWVTNPPWGNEQGAQDEKAARFLSRAVNSLAEGGLLAFVLPASWLNGRQHRRSRSELGSLCDLFEVWRLPRDMFAPEARQPAAVVFAQRTKESRDRRFAYRWVTASKAHREQFVSRRAVQFQSAREWTDDASVVDGPVDVAIRSNSVLGDIVELTGGVVQRGSKVEFSASGTPFLPRRVRVAAYRAVDRSSTIPTDLLADPHKISAKRLDRLVEYPKLLIRAARFPDNAWRLVPAVDTFGLVPANTWHVICGEAESIYALNAYLSSSLASCYVHTHATTQWIALNVLRNIPLPPNWHARHRAKFAELGLQMAEHSAEVEETIDAADFAVNEAFELDDSARSSISKIMAGYLAPDGRIRVPESSNSWQSHSEETTVDYDAPGAVSEVQRSTLRTRIHADPELDQVIEIPNGMPGWLLVEGATFNLTGTLAHGRYRLHRSAHMTDAEIFGQIPERTI